MRSGAIVLLVALTLSIASCAGKHGTDAPALAPRPGELPLVVIDGRTPVPMRAPEAWARDTIRMAEHGGAPHTYSGYPLRSLLRARGVKVDSLRGRSLARTVVLAARDGYRVAFGAGELDSGVVPRRWLLVDRMEGAPLDSVQGPWRLIVEGDREPKRWIRQVTVVRVDTLVR